MTQRAGNSRTSARHAAAKTIAIAIAGLAGAMVLEAGSMAFAAVSQVPIGPRAIAMGGAFSSIANDPTALFWNPAGLSSVATAEVFGSRANLFGAGIIDNVLGVAIPLSGGQTIGGQFYGSGFEDAGEQPELKFLEKTLSAGYSRRIWSGLSIGFAGKYFLRDVDLDATDLRSGDGIGANVGAMLDLGATGVRVGAVLQDAGNTTISYKGIGGASKVGSTLRGAVSWSRDNLGVLAVDVDDRVHVGLEYRGLPIVALRGGGQRGLEAFDDDFVWSAGLGVEQRIGRDGVIRVDYALESHPVLGETHHVGLTLGFPINPVHARILQVSAPPVYFASRSGADQALIGQDVVVEVENRRAAPLGIELSLTANADAFRGRTATSAELRPNADSTIRLPLTISPDLMGSVGGREVPLSVELSYGVGQRKRSHFVEDRRVVVHGLGAVDWTKGVDQAAMFVTPQDPVIVELGDVIRRHAVERDTPAFPTREFRDVALAVSLVAAAGVRYAPDPVRPFGSDSIDRVAYPRETLVRKSGDCDDLSALMASLLLQLGVETRILDTKTHQFVMADAGLTSDQLVGLDRDPNLFVVDQGRVWLPVETTAPGRGLIDSWTLGAERLRRARQEGVLTEVDLAAAMRRYPPSGWDSRPAPAGVLDEANLRVGLTRDATMIERLMVPDRVRAGGLRTGHRARLARLEAERGNLIKARAHMDTLRSQGSRGGEIMGIDALLALAEARDSEAVRLLTELRSREPSNPAILLNLGLIRFATGQREPGLTMIRRAISELGGMERALQLLLLERTDASGLGDDALELAMLWHAGWKRPGCDRCAPRLYWGP